jgi:hypothetical protein
MTIININSRLCLQNVKENYKHAAVTRFPKLVCNSVCISLGLVYYSTKSNRTSQNKFTEACCVGPAYYKTCEKFRDYLSDCWLLERLLHVISHYFYGVLTRVTLNLEIVLIWS